MDQNLDERQIRVLEQELHVEILPGTEIMKDVGVKHFVHSASNHDRVLVPQPSDDPHDPLNWSTKWKTFAIIATTYMTFTQGFGPLSLAPMFGNYIEEFHCTLPEAVQFTGVAILVLGFSNFVWVPLSTTFGRRPVMLVTQIINIASAIWRAKATSYGSFMGASALNGFAAGPAETLQPAIIADLFFLHDRGKWNTLYFAVYFGSLAVAPIISGAMAVSVGWRNFWWLFVAMLIVSFLMCLFMYPETKYDRLHMVGHKSSPPQSGKSGSPTGEKSDIAGYEEKSITESSLDRTTTAEQDPYLGRGTPSKEQWRLFTPNKHPFKTMLIDFWTPWKLFIFPIVEFASFVVSWSASSFLTLNLTQTQAFAPPVEAGGYGFSEVKIGFTNFAILIGMGIGLVTAGPLSDWIAQRLTVRNGGIREPEMRLPTMIPYVLIMILGNVIVALGYQYHWHWAIIVVIGYTCAGIQVAALPSIATTYAVDSYKPVAGSLMVAITVNKNVWGYGFSKFINPWIIEVGYIPPIMLNMALITLWCLFGILFFYMGKTFRRWSKNDKVHFM